MARILTLLLWLFLTAGTPAFADTGPIVLKVERIWPGLDETLPPGASLFVSIGYRTDVALRFQAQGYAGGKLVEGGAMFNSAPPHPAGAGKALTFVAFRDTATIDEVRILVFDERWKSIKTISLPAKARWRPAAHAAPPQPEWLDALAAAETELSGTAGRQAAAGPDTFLDLVMGFLLTAGVPLYLALQIYLPMKLRKGWRIAALGPLVVMGAAAVHAILALSQGSNLWPIVVILVAPLALAYLSGLFIVSLAAGAWRQG